MNTLKKLQFAVAILVISIAKIWHDSFRSYMTITNNLSSFLHPQTMLNAHTIGLAIGGIAAGVFTDSFTAKRVGFISIFGIALTSFFLISPYIFLFDSYIRVFLMLLLSVALLSLIIVRVWILTKLDSFMRNQRSGPLCNITLLLISSIMFAFLNAMFSFYLNKVLSYILGCGYVNFLNIQRVHFYEIFICSFIMYLLVSINTSISMISTVIILPIICTIFSQYYGIRSWSVLNSLDSIIFYSPISFFMHKLLCKLESMSNQNIPYLQFFLFLISYCMRCCANLIDCNIVQSALCDPRIPIILSIINYGFIFLRAILIGSAMNSGYATIGTLYKGSPFLSVATSILYMFLFGILTITPLCLKFVFSIKSFLVLSLISFFIGIAISIWKSTKSQELALWRSTKSIVTVAKNNNILLAAFISMIFIGNFYNILSIFKYLSEINVKFYTIEFMQFIGRLFTFLSTALIVFSPKQYKTSHENCARRIAISLIVVILMSFSLIFASLLKYSGVFIVVFFCLNCLTLGIAQSMAKALLLGAANKSNSNLCGSAQSISTFANTFIEILGCWILPFKCNCTFQIGILSYNLLIIASSVTVLIYTLLNTDNINQVLNKDSTN